MMCGLVIDDVMSSCLVFVCLNVGNVVCVS